MIVLSEVTWNWNSINPVYISMIVVQVYFKLRGCLHEISFRATWNIFMLVSGQFLVTVYMIQTEMKLVAGIVALRSFWQKRNFISGDRILCKHYLKWNLMKGNICTCVNKNDWLLLSGLFISGRARNEIRFISPTMKSNVNRISFTVDWNFVSGRFHFGSHINTPSVSTLPTNCKQHFLYTNLYIIYIEREFVFSILCRKFWNFEYPSILPARKHIYALHL